MRNRTILLGGLVSALISTALVSGCDNSPQVETTKNDGDGNPDGEDSITTPEGAGGEGAGSGAPDTCGGEFLEGDPRPANILLVVDTSGSMEGTPTGFEKTKWETLVESLDDSLPAVQDLISFGVKLFPSGNTDPGDGGNVCNIESGIDVPIASGADGVGAVNTALSTASPGGDTPTAAALADALDYFENGAGAELEGNNFVLLATDGGPNCSDAPKTDCTCTGDQSDPSCGVANMCVINIDERVPGVCDLSGSAGSCCQTPQTCLDDAGTVDAVQALADAGIQTIVVGMPGSEAYEEVLDELAVTGGRPAQDSTPRYNRVDDAAALTEAMTDLTRDVVRTCEIQLQSTPQDLGLVNVYLENEVIPQNDEDGWRYDESTTPPTVLLTGPTCDQVEKEGVENIQITFGCKTIVIR